MQRSAFNDGWEVRAGFASFVELATGAPTDWVPVQLPHDAMIDGVRDPAGSAATGYFPGGEWEYRKRFDVPADHAGKRLLLEFEGVYRSGVVLVNHSFAGHRPYGYSKFTVAIDHLVECGAANEIRVRAIAHDDSRWYSGAGIHRGVSLLVGEPVRLALDAVHITTPDIDDLRAVVAIDTVVENDSARTATTTVTTEIVDRDGTVVARDVSPLTVFAGRSETLRQRLVVVEPQRWSVDDPALYSCRTVLSANGVEVDRESTAFGVRSLQLDPVHGLRINGEEVLLRGACVHHDNGVIGAATIPRADERRVELLKAAGFNALRSAHQPMSDAMLDACDRVGMLVMDEAFDMWNGAKHSDDYSHAFPDWWQADVEAMVRKDRNRPSVIMYSIGNEIPETGRPAGASLGRRMAECIRALDSTRFVTNSINAMLACGIIVPTAPSGGAEADAPPDAAAEGAGINTMMTEMQEFMPMLLRTEGYGQQLAESFAAVDVAGYNYLEARYELDGELFPNRVIVGSETLPTTIDANWKQVLANPHVIGDFTWTGWDYLGEAGIGRIGYDDGDRAEGGGPDSMILAAYPWLVAWCGDLDITGHRRPASYYREIVFGLRREPYLAVQRPEHHGEVPAVRSGWTWSDTIASWTWPGHEQRPITVEVYSSADEVELLVNGTSVGRAPTGSEHAFRAEFETTFQPGTITAVAYRDGAESERTSLMTADERVRLELHADRTEIRADSDDLAFVEITLTDEAGTVHTAADRSITLTVDGPAVLQGFGSANPRTEETFGRPTHDTYEGRALAVIRPNRVGTITVTATTLGCDPSTLAITAR